MFVIFLVVWCFLCFFQDSLQGHTFLINWVYGHDMFRKSVTYVSTLKVNASSEIIVHHRPQFQNLMMDIALLSSTLRPFQTSRLVWCHLNGIPCH